MNYCENFKQFPNNICEENLGPATASGYSATRVINDDIQTNSLLDKMKDIN